MNFLFLLIFVPSYSSAMDLKEFLSSVQAKHKLVQALEHQKEAANLRNVSGDVSLNPVFTAGTYVVDDKSPLNQFVMLGASESKITDYNLGFAKKFASGTSVGLSADATEYENPGIAGPYAALTKLGSGSLGLTLSQSLWKDSFGESTRLRRAQQSVATSAEKGRYDLQVKALLVAAEQAYWSYLYALESVKISKDSLERAQRIETWTRRRVADGISERADLLQTQALVSARQLMLISSQDDLAAAQQALCDYLELPNVNSLPSMTGNISMPRSLRSMIQNAQGQGEFPKDKILALDAYLAAFDSKARGLAADQVEDAYRPDLVLSGAYQTHSMNQDLHSAVTNIGNTDRPTSKVSLNFTYMFDNEVKRAARDSAKKDALAAKLIGERKVLESDSTWLELNRRYAELSQQIQLADQVMKIQDERAKAEAALFNKGRSITANVVNAEEDAGTAKLNLVRLKSTQRKMEAQGQLFVFIE